MADSVSSQLLENGNQRWAYNFTSASDGTGETAVVKVDPTSSGPLGVTIAGNTLYPGAHLTVDEIRFQINGGSVNLKWDATTPLLFANLISGSDTLVFTRRGGGLYSPVVAGATGKITFTTSGFGAGSGYSIWMFGKKGIRQ